MSHPDPPDDPPRGYHYEASDNDVLQWRAIEHESERRRCRMLGSVNGQRRACGKPSVAALNRGYRSINGDFPSWWHYCADHLYGRWIEDGKVMHWRLVPDAARDQQA